MCRGPLTSCSNQLLLFLWIFSLINLTHLPMLSQAHPSAICCWLPTTWNTPLAPLTLPSKFTTIPSNTAKCLPQGCGDSRRSKLCLRTRGARHYCNHVPHDLEASLSTWSQGWRTSGCNTAESLDKSSSSSYAKRLGNISMECTQLLLCLIMTGGCRGSCIMTGGGRGSCIMTGGGRGSCIMTGGGRWSCIMTGGGASWPLAVASHST